jgi:hypothetical protein
MNGYGGRFGKTNRANKKNSPYFNLLEMCNAGNRSGMDLA